jgi:gliding-associated putative ABC transporter substrate-binding component GldG
MQRRQTFVRLSLVAGILILVNIIAVRIFTRFDLTSTKMYTLSDASKNLVKSLDDKFTVKAYFTGELPAPYNNHRRYLQDQLDEYRAYGGQNFQYEFIDPSKKEELEQEAQKNGIPPVQVQVVKEDKFQVEKAYMGLVFLYGDKQEKLPVVQNVANLEYEISSVIKKLTSKELKKVGFLSGHGEPELTALNRLKGTIEKQYEISTVNLTNDKNIPDDIAVLVIDAPAQPFKTWEVFLIDQYIMRGGKVAFFLNKVSATLQDQMGRSLTLGIEDMLETYGVRINNDLVRDVRCASVTVQQQSGFFVIQNQVPFAYLPIASEFSKTSPIAKDLGGMVFFFTSSLDTSLARQKGLSLEVLAQTSNRSGRQENFFMINPTAPMTEEMFKESGIPLAVTIEGKFQSAFASNAVELDSTVAGEIDTSKKVLSSVTSKIVVVGDGDFIQDQYSGGSKDNIIFASNVIDYLADDIGLASIRSRETSAKPLDEVSEGTRAWVKGLNLTVPPLLVILAGILRWRWRTTMRKRLESRGL